MHDNFIRRRCKHYLEGSSWTYLSTYIIFGLGPLFERIYGNAGFLSKCQRVLNVMNSQHPNVLKDQLAKSNNVGVYSKSSGLRNCCTYIFRPRVYWSDGKATGSHQLAPHPPVYELLDPRTDITEVYVRYTWRYFSLGGSLAPTYFHK